MKNKIRITAVILIIVLLAAPIVSCTKAAKMNTGTISGNTFTNDYFGIEVKFPDGYYTCSDAQLVELLNAGSELLAVDKKTYDYSNEQLIPFFCVMENNLFDAATAATITGVNMNIIAQAEKLSLISSLSVKNETDYLNAVKAQMDAAFEEGISYTFGDIKSEDIGGKTFYKADVTGDYDGVTVDQIFYCYKQNDYVLVMTVTYDPAVGNHVQVLNDFLAGISFK